MGIAFVGWYAPGIVEPLAPGSAEAKMLVNSFWGQQGESALVSGATGRDIPVRLLCYGGFGSYDFAREVRENAQRLIGSNGELVIEGHEFTERFGDCTLVAAQVGEEGILPDLAGTLDGGWFFFIRLLWRQHVLD